ncbi:hypothetical protein BUALT_Bualt01G0213500 [Buddleja alternifolia]|uniref:FHA domain-containing protein n=1 Tax=Buddleja alternifolia TaxID=168488 RepID=A0AAV6YJE7_9LAMI|nr:hypothetical protein BUALT_Bualt01G0213500 [Buddleja alternifolia]
MEREDESPTPPQPPPQIPKPTPSPNSAQASPSISQSRRSDEPHTGGSNHHNKSSSPLSKNVQNGEDFISSVAAKIAAQPFQYSDPDVWGVLTAISEKARKRHQGMNMLLTSDEHCIGRLVDDGRFQIIAPAVSAHHCKIYRKRVATVDPEHPSDSCSSVFLKDTSTNGTYLNWEKLNKSSSEAKLQHGDIISIAFVPQHELAFAFVFREVQKSPCVSDSKLLKRKPEEYGAENKRLKGIGIGSSDGPISLDDFRSLQKSNMELRKLLENQVGTIESLQSENRAAIEKHETEMRELKESVSKSYLDQLTELNQSLEAKDKELAEINRLSAEQKHGIEDLNERLSASMQSCVEANEIINSQKTSISEMKALLDEERDQRREEREKASVDLKISVQRVQAEAAEEIKRVSDGALKREKEQQEMINKLQEAEKERCSLVETLRSKLEDARQKLVNSDNKVRQLEAQIRQDQQAFASVKKRVEELEQERKRLRKELEHEKCVLYLKLRVFYCCCSRQHVRKHGQSETQLRAFYSTTEEISVLFTKQQEQLKSMQRTLEDEENYETTSVDIDQNPDNANGNLLTISDKCLPKAGSGAFRSQGTNQVESSSDGTSVTEKHDCNSKILGNGEEDTQDVEFTSTERNNVNGGFGSDINGIGTAPTSDGTEQIPETEGLETERVIETESLGLHNGRNVDLNKCSLLAGDTMQIDDNNDNNPDAQEAPENDQKISRDQNSPIEVQDPMEDTEEGIRTADLLASEVAGSWACSTAPSVHGENDSLGCKDDYDPENKENGDGEEGVVPLHDSSSLVAESQHIPSSRTEAAVRRDHERRALSEMIGIVAPDLREQFSCAVGSDDGVGVASSSSDTEDCSDNNERDEGGVRGASDAETVGSERAMSGNEMDENDDTQEDSVG